MCVFHMFYGFSVKPQGIMTLSADCIVLYCVCVFMSVWSYVGHVENDSGAGH